MRNTIPHLTSVQEEAITYTDGPLLIVAGAGTGKTTVITKKMEYLIREGKAKPEEILALTFSERAAREMQERMDVLLDMGYVTLSLSTFHAFCQHVLERYGLEVGLPNRFRVLDELGAWLLIKQSWQEFDLDYYRPIGNPGRYLKELIRHFGKCKDERILPDDYLAFAEEQVREKNGGETAHEAALEQKKYRELAQCYHTYNRLLLEQDALDFGDLILHTLRLFKERPNILQALQKEFRFLLVDEFQDVNYAQYELVRLLAGEENQLTVVGDDDQSIYAFRGASVANILRFKEDYPHAREIVLKENYRSGQTILDAAYALIQHNNPDRLEVKLEIDKHLVARGDTASKGMIQHLSGESIDDEVSLVCEQIQTLSSKEGLLLDEIAILVRANRHATPFLEGLERAGIPYEYLSSSGLYREPFVLACIDYLRLIDNYRESISIYRLLLLSCFHFSEHDMQAFASSAKKKAISYYAALTEARTLGLSAEGVAACERLLSLIHTGIARAKTEKPTAVLYHFFDSSGSLKLLAEEEEKGSRSAIRDLSHLKQFFDVIHGFEVETAGASVSLFLEYFTEVLESGETGRIEPVEETADSVNLMTVHAAKGLEFRAVFLVNMVEDRFPASKKGEGISIPLELVREHLPKGDYRMEEERRLCYVGMTRAKEYLFCTSALDYGGVRSKKISRFLVESGLANTPMSSPSSKKRGKILMTPVALRKAEQPQRTLYLLPKTFSFSQIRSFEMCPYQYKMLHLLHIPMHGNPRFSFGTSMHITLQRFYEKVKRLNTSTQVSLFAIPQDAGTQKKGLQIPSLEDLLQIYDEAWIPDWYEDEQHRLEAYRKGKTILKAFYQKQEGTWTVPLALEKGFRISVGPYIITGKIDRIDRTESGGLHILDYKTGSPKEKLASEEKQQLLLYQIAAETLSSYRTFGPVEALTYLYLKEQIKEQTFLGDAKQKETLKVHIIEVLDRLHATDFSAITLTDACGRCEVCEFLV